MNDNRHHQTLINFFKNYLINDQKLIEAIQSFGLSFQLTADSWQFTLLDLHRFCQMNIPDISNLNYQQFKQLLYQNPTNQALSEYGGKFEILSNSGQVDRSIYCLTQLKKA